jgi:hypothetical protein
VLGITDGPEPDGQANFGLTALIATTFVGKIQKGWVFNRALEKTMPLDALHHITVKTNNRTGGVDPKLPFAARETWAARDPSRTLMIGGSLY